MIRLKDVAAQAGVSVMTVSKVLRGAPDVSQATKVRIRQLAEKMGYLPDSLAQGLRTRRTRLFGLVIPSITHPLLAHAAVAISDRVQELGYDLLLCQTQDNPQQEEACIHRLLSRRIDGLFLYPVYRLAPSAPVYEELWRSGTPTVLIGHRASFCSQFASVETEDAASSFQLTRHLIGLGHRRIAFFAGPSVAPWAQERLDGYRRALREAEVEFDDRLIFTAGISLEDGEKAGLQLLSEATEATAVQAVTDFVAMGVATMFLGQDWKIPDDISIAGFGNNVAAEHFRVPLTTIRQPKFGIGVAATEILLKLMRGEAVESRRLNSELVVRASTGPPPSRAHFSKLHGSESPRYRNRTEG